jgi:hypothetical protein
MIYLRITGGNPMALFDDVLEGGNVVTGLAIGTAALIAWPLVSPILRPLAKTAVKGGILGYREAARLCDSTVRGSGDLAREAIVELGGDATKKAAEEVGTNLAKEVVEEVAVDLAKEAV